MRLLTLTLILTLAVAGLAMAADPQPAKSANPHSGITTRPGVANPHAGMNMGAMAEDTSETLSNFKTTDEKLSYFIGYQVGGGIKQQGINLEKDAMQQGIMDAMADKKPVLAQSEVMEVMNTLREKQMARMQEQQSMSNEANKANAANATKNKEEGQKYMTQNGKKKGVITTPSGLQYEVLREGAGASPKASDKVRVHYKGALINGEEFDSSYKRNEPTEFGVGEVIKGWTEGLQLMKKGANYRFVIPPQLGYGEMGTPDGGIPPNSTLVFEVELLDIMPGK